MAGVCFGSKRMSGLKKAMQKRQAWTAMGENGQAFVNGVIERFGISRIIIIKGNEHYDSSRYVGGTGKTKRNL